MSYVFELVTVKQTFVLAVDTEADRQTWMVKLARVCIILGEGCYSPIAVIAVWLSVWSAVRLSQW